MEVTKAELKAMLDFQRSSTMTDEQRGAQCRELFSKRTAVSNYPPCGPAKRQWGRRKEK